MVSLPWKRIRQLFCLDTVQSPRLCVILRLPTISTMLVLLRIRDDFYNVGVASYP